MPTGTAPPAIAPSAKNRIDGSDNQHDADRELRGSVEQTRDQRSADHGPASRMTTSVSSNPMIDGQRRGLRRRGDRRAASPSLGLGDAEGRNPQAADVPLWSTPAMMTGATSADEDGVEADMDAPIRRDKGIRGDGPRADRFSDSDDKGCSWRRGALRDRRRWRRTPSVAEARVSTTAASVTHPAGRRTPCSSPDRRPAGTLAVALRPPARGSR